MPVLSKFYGIVIRMYFLRDFAARFHAFYGSYELVVNLTPLRVVQGEAPRRVEKLVLEWAQAHQNELFESWQRLSLAEQPFPIEPLV